MQGGDCGSIYRPQLLSAEPSLVLIFFTEKKKNTVLFIAPKIKVKENPARLIVSALNLSPYSPDFSTKNRGKRKGGI